MRSFVLTVAVLVAFTPAHVAAELVRLELGADTGAAVPATFEELATRCGAAGFSISWQDPPYYNANFSGVDPASVGSVTALALSDTITFSWIEFDDGAAAARYAAELDTMYAGAGYLRYRLGGRRVLQAFAQSDNGDNAEAALDLIAGP
jgi:hypothetical protein